MRRGGALFGVLAAVFLGLYFTGHLDRLLFPVGLNFDECARNGLGVTFCGSELDEYRARVEQTKREGEAAEAKSKEEAQAIQVRGEEEQARIKQRGEEQQSAIRHRLKTECAETSRPAVERVPICREWEQLADEAAAQETP